MLGSSAPLLNLWVMFFLMANRRFFEAANDFYKWQKGVGWFFPSAFFLPTLFHFKSLLLGRPKLAKSPMGPNGLQVSSTQMINIRGATTTTVGRGPRLSVLPDVTPQLFTAILPPWQADTVWKFHDFSITQILREINFGDCKSAKSAILTHLEALNFDFYEIVHFLKAQINQKSKYRIL